MARFVFFSFRYEDVMNFKVNVVRNSWLVKNSQETFVDGSIWEKSKMKGESFLKKLIEDGLNQTSVTAVLVGVDTANRRWVNYEIIKSFERGNGILGVHINKIKGLKGRTKRGQNPLDRLSFKVSEDGVKIYFYELKNGRWKVFSDLPSINNRKSNSLFFNNHWWRGNEFGKTFRFSDKFLTKCWIQHEGQINFSSWIESCATQAGR